MDYDETAATNVTTTHHRPHFPRTLYSTCALFCAWRRWDASTTFKTHSVSHLTSDIINIHFYCRKKWCKVLFGDRKILTFELDWQFVRLTWWHQNMGLLQLDPEKWSHLLICWPAKIEAFIWHGTCVCVILCARCYVSSCHCQCRRRSSLYFINIWNFCCFPSKILCVLTQCDPVCCCCCWFLNSCDAPWPTQSQNAFALPPFLLLLFVSFRFECVFVFKLISFYVRRAHTAKSRINSERVQERKFNCTLLFIQFYWMPP